MRDLEYEITLLRQRVDEIRRDLDALQQVMESPQTDKPIVTIPHTKGVSDAEL